MEKKLCDGTAGASPPPMNATSTLSNAPYLYEEIHMAINNIGNSTAMNSPSLSDQKSFQNEIKDKSIGDLAKMAGDKNAPEWKREEAVKELLKDLLKGGEEDNGLDDEDKKSLEDLLKALTGKGKGNKGEKGGNGDKGDTAKGADVLATVLQALGVPGELAQGISDAIGGQSEGKI
jgi:hypothetical protein